MTYRMSRRGNCWDNAVVKSLCGRLKTELIHPTVCLTRAMARTNIVASIEGFYSRKRLHSSIDFLPPNQVEDNYYLPLQPPVPA